MRKKGALVFLAILLTSCATIPPPAPIQNILVIDAPYDKTWEAAIDVITEEQLSISAIEKASGVVSTGFVHTNKISRLSNISSLDVVWGQGGRYLLSILVRRKEANKTSVRINLQIEGFDRVFQKWVALPSNGNLELYFLAELQKRIGYSGVGVLARAGKETLPKQTPEQSRPKKHFSRHARYSHQESKKAKKGLKIVGFTEISPAREAGLELNDLILEINGVPAKTKFDLPKLMGEEGSTVKLKVSRDGEAKEIELVRQKIK